MSKRGAADRLIILETGRAALVVDGRLEDLMVDPSGLDAPRVPGSIGYATVERRVPKLGAAFVRLWGGAMGFLREAKHLSEGARLLVQVVSYPEAGKAAPVTARVLYKARTVIHTPHAPGVNVSRQIREPEARDRLAAIVASAARALGAPEPGFVVRTAAGLASEDELREDVRACLARRAAAESGAPQVEQAAEVAEREWEGRALREEGGFERFGVLDEVERLQSPRADLPSGAWMAVEPTAALVAVDVNTGGAFQAGDGLSANLEAARELPRQLRLRGLGGLVMVDFAPTPKRDRRRIEDALKTAFSRDPVETSLAGWTTLGLFECQRKRERLPLALWSGDR